MTDFAHTVELTLAVMQQLYFQYIWIIVTVLVIAPRVNEKIAHWRHKRDMRRG